MVGMVAIQKEVKVLDITIITLLTLEIQVNLEHCYFSHGVKRTTVEAKR